MTRAALLGTTALVAAGHSGGVRADVTIVGNTTNTVGPLVAGDNITITNSGSVTGTFVGIAVTGATSSGTLTNNGSINVTNRGIVVTSAGVSGAVRNVGNITAGTSGIRVATSASVTGGVRNEGTIDANVNGIGVFSQGSVSGGITNTGGALIFGSVDNGINIRSSSNVSGGISNGGSIAANAFGISVFSSSVVGGINNSGTVQTTGVTVGTAISFGFGSTVNGGITNSGLIQSGAGGNAIGVSGSILNDGIVNQAGGRILASGNAAIVLSGPSTVSGGIDNQGTISGGSAVATSGAATIDTIDNSGLMSGTVTGIEINGAVTGGIDNSGTISGGSADGLFVRFTSASVGGIVNQAGALISGAANGVNISTTAQITGGISNSGTIEGDVDGIRISNEVGITSGLKNTGTINGGSIGISIFDEVTIGGGIDNGSTIEGDFVGVRLAIDVLVDGDIVNSGVIQGDAGGLVVIGDSTVTGAIRNSGTISGSTGIFLGSGMPVTNGIFNTGVIIGTGGTAIQFGDDDDTLTLGTGSAITGTSDGSMGDDALNLIESGSEDDPIINFEQLNMNGVEWTLVQDLTLSTGTTLPGDVNLNSGVLNVNGNLTAPGGVNAFGGTLGGTGDVVANVAVGAGGAIAPGNSIGVLNVVGDVAFGAGSSFDVEVEGSAADLLNITGNVTIDPAATVNILPLGAGIDVVDQVIINATGTVDANFQNIETNGLLATTELLGSSQIILSAVSPVATEVGGAAGVQDSFAFQDSLVGPVGGIGAFMIGPETQIWAKGIYEFNERDDNVDFAGFDQETSGFVLGLDAKTTDTLRMGFAVGYTESDVEINMRTGDTDVKGLYGGVYGLYEKNAFRLNFGAQAGAQDKDLTRPVMVSGVTTNVTSTVDANTFGAHAKGGWAKGINETWASSFNLNAAYIHQSQDEYTDSVGVIFGDFDTDTIRFGPSVDLIGTFLTGGAQIRPRASLGYLQQWTGGDDLVDVTFSSGLSQSAAIEDRDEGFATIGVGLDALFDNGVTAFVGYDGEHGDDETRNRITAGLRIGL